jgi:hypothetical protein
MRAAVWENCGAVDTRQTLPIDGPFRTFEIVSATDRSGQLYAMTRPYSVARSPQLKSLVKLTDPGLRGTAASQHTR